METGGGTFEEKAARASRVIECLEGLAKSLQELYPASEPVDEDSRVMLLEYVELARGLLPYETPVKAAITRLTTILGEVSSPDNVVEHVIPLTVGLAVSNARAIATELKATYYPQPPRRSRPPRSDAYHSDPQRQIIPSLRSRCSRQR
jgi:hypothetical protein